ncbi:hypothetical protein M758_9G099700 [Ceratodon purpureus]|nr:hypothetical protein M758_9G099700 [Ceratodon purpureus]
MSFHKLLFGTQAVIQALLLDAFNVSFQLLFHENKGIQIHKNRFNLANFLQLVRKLSFTRACIM